MRYLGNRTATLYFTGQDFIPRRCRSLLCPPGIAWIPNVCRAGGLSMAAKHLLFELGSEELPPKTLVKLSQAFTGWHI